MVSTDYVGVFAKGLGMLDLWRDILAITIIELTFLALSIFLAQTGGVRCHPLRPQRPPISRKANR